MTLVQAARGLGLSARTVRNHVEKLRRENTIYALPTLNMGGIPGLIPVTLSYSYSRSESKGMVDRAILSRFEASYLSVMFSDPDRGYISLSASTMTDVQDYLEWEVAAWRCERQNRHTHQDVDVSRQANRAAQTQK
jgi:hypothetical protein